MHNNLNHLTPEDIDELMEKYYKGISVDKLKKEYSLNVNSSHLYTLFPPVVCEEKCNYCDANLETRRKSKSSFNYRKSPECPVCGHNPYYPNCSCSNCLNLAMNIRSERSKTIKRSFSIETKKIKFEDISFENKVKLGAFCNLLMDEDVSTILAYDEVGKIEKLSPSEAMKISIYKELAAINAIVISPDSSVDAFYFSEENILESYIVDKVRYKLNIEYTEDKKDLYMMLMNPKYYNFEYEKEAYDFWLAIAVEECIEYLVYQLKSANFEFNAGEKTYRVIEMMLETFSVSQVYGIIWKAVADVSKLYLQKNLTRKHAANTAINTCERLADTAKIKGWDMSKYNRDKNLPQSEISRFFFNKVIKIGDQGFYMVPTKNIENIVDEVRNFKLSFKKSD